MNKKYAIFASYLIYINIYILFRLMDFENIEMFRAGGNSKLEGHYPSCV